MEDGDFCYLISAWYIREGAETLSKASCLAAFKVDAAFIVAVVCTAFYAMKFLHFSGKQ